MHFLLSPLLILLDALPLFVQLGHLEISLNVR